MSFSPYHMMGCINDRMGNMISAQLTTGDVKLDHSIEILSARSFILKLLFHSYSLRLFHAQGQVKRIKIYILQGAVYTYYKEFRKTFFSFFFPPVFISCSYLFVYLELQSNTTSFSCCSNWSKFTLLQLFQLSSCILFHPIDLCPSFSFLNTSCFLFSEIFQAHLACSLFQHYNQ